jgi:glutamyl-tRNA synthetase
MSFYQQAAEKLLKEGKAYPCYCTPEELEKKREAALKAGIKPKYDRTCLHQKSFPPGKAFAIRFLSPDTGKTVVEDLIQAGWNLTIRNWMILSSLEVMVSHL